jgi:hypothetical protein
VQKKDVANTPFAVVGVGVGGIAYQNVDKAAETGKYL